MSRMFVRHEVEDYAKWRKVYDDFDATRTAMGVRGAGVYRDASNGNSITAYHDFESVEAAQAFAGSDELKAAMGDAGVSSAPEIWFTEPA